LRLLDQKIKLFELVIGELDVILGDFGGADTLEERLADAWLSAESDQVFDQRLDQIGEEIVASREAGRQREAYNSEVAADDNAQQLEREFDRLSIPARVRLAYGTNHLQPAPGVEAKRQQIGLHVGEIVEALESVSSRGDPSVHPDFGPVTLLRGITGSGRSVTLTVQADRLPMTLVDLAADGQAPQSLTLPHRKRGARR
jgi:hypothetical protein